MTWYFIHPMRGHPWVPGEQIAMGRTAATAKPGVQGVSGGGSPITWPAKYRILL